MDCVKVLCSRGAPLDAKTEVREEGSSKELKKQQEQKQKQKQKKKDRQNQEPG